jgi:cystathionine beta-synthase/cysteine synthase A
MIFNSIMETIGQTPMVRLRNVKMNDADIMVKLESFNPGGSIKDRTALYMIKQAERDGRLTPKSTVIESTSGNLGKSLALIGAVEGYRVILVVDPKTPRSMIEFATALGAKIEMVDVPDESGGYQRPRVARVRQMLAESPDLFWPDQYNNPDNPRAHAEHTANEILSDTDDFDVLVAAVSTGGHISGIATTLKKHLPDLTVIGVDAAGSAAFGFPFQGYQMHGLGLAWQPDNLDLKLVDRVHLIADHEGVATSRLLARHEGILVGESAGAAVFGALHYAHHHPGSRIVVIAADGAANYLTESFDDEWLQHCGLAERISRAGLNDLDGLMAAARQPTNSSLDMAELSPKTVDKWPIPAKE